MELEPKITEVVLIRDHENNPLEPQACNLYLKNIKMDKYKITFLVDCFLSNLRKKQREKSASSDLETDTKRQNRSTSRTSSSEKDVKMDRDHSTSRQREGELKTSLAVDSSQASSAT